MKLRHVFVLPLCLISVAAFADGNQLLDNCQLFVTSIENPKIAPLAADALSAGFCAGMVASAWQLSPMLPPDSRACVPDGVPISQRVRIVLKWLKENPKHLNLDETALITIAFQQTYPCK